MDMDLIFATNNMHKLEEVRSLLKDYCIKSLSDIMCNDELPETSETIEGNALQKARYINDKYNANCFADDTGLEIEALNGMPGVYSARYAGEARLAENNMQKVLVELKGVKNRKARFKTIIALIINKNEYVFEGIVNGTISEEKRGEKGFGYDPIFIPEGFDKSFAEMDFDEKNRFSHRAFAIKKLVGFLERY